jgi:sialic acid synthase SpsE
MEKVKIGNKLIGDGEHCFIIAEAGSNHNGSLEQGTKRAGKGICERCTSTFT